MINFLAHLVAAQYNGEDLEEKKTVWHDDSSFWKFQSASDQVKQNYDTIKM